MKHGDDSERIFHNNGKALSPVSELNAFDLALKKAGVAQCNLVSVSSILPKDCVEIENHNIPAGSITHSVLARMNGEEGTTIGAGIAWTWAKSKKYGLVAEAHGFMDKKALEETLEWKIREMAKIRGIKIGLIQKRMEVLRVPMDNYGCVISALVYNP